MRLWVLLSWLHYFSFGLFCNRPVLQSSLPVLPIFLLPPLRLQSSVNFGCFVWNPPAVKLSDSPVRAMGPVVEITRYRRVFQVSQQISLPAAV